jgi:hypothetical protein
MRASFLRAAFVLAAAVPATLLAADVLSQLGIPPGAATEAVGTVITAGISNPGLPAQAFKALPPAARAQAAAAGVAWVKTYVNSPDFRRQYAQIKQHHKPEAPAWDRTPEQELQKQDEEQKQQLSESKEAIASLPPEQRKAVEAAMQNAADLSARMNTPEMRKMKLDGITSERTERTQEYEAALARWKQDYPDDPKPIVVRRLREFLQLSADVDYNAKVTSLGSALVFENPAYQAKSSQWKMCYRAGREATAAARAAVQAWLGELGG